MLRKKCSCGKAAWGRCGHNWFASFKIAGTRREVATGAADRDAAIVEGSRRKLELRTAAGTDLRERCRLSQLAAAHLGEKSKEGVTPERLKVIEYHWRPVLRHFKPDFDPAALTYSNLEAYRDARREHGVRGQTIEREAWCLKQGLRIAKRRGWIKEQPVPLDEWPVIGHDPKDERRAGKLHDHNVLRAVLAECDQDLRERIEFSARTGLRKHELLRMEYSWIERPPKGYALPAMLAIPATGSKTGRPRLVPLPRQALAILKRRHAASAQKRLVFPGDRKKLFYRAIDAAREKAAKRLGKQGAIEAGYFVNVTLRDMRHAYLTAGEHATKDRKAAADVAGHARLKTTEIYLHSDLDRLAAFASAAGGWFKGAEGGGRKVSRRAPQKSYFPYEKLVGTPGIEPGTPTVSSEGRGSKRNKIKDRTGHGGHVKSATCIAGGRTQGRKAAR